MVAQALGQLIAVHDAAHLAACRAARRQNDPVSGEFLAAFGADEKAAAFLRMPVTGQAVCRSTP